MEKDLCGQKFGNLTVLKKCKKDEKHRTYIYKCRCDCGNITYQRTDHLTRGDVISCGCVQRKRLKDASKKVIENNRVDGTYLPNLTQGLNKRNKTGVKGVCWVTSKSKYRAAITLSGKTYHLGYFNTIKEAAEARKLAENELYKPILDRNNVNVLK